MNCILKKITNISQQFAKHYEQEFGRRRDSKLFLFMSFAFFVILLLLNGFIYFSEAKNCEESYCVVIDPGHGGRDPGKVGVNDVLEKDVNLEIALLVKSELEKQGVKVLLTRETDCDLAKAGATNMKTSDMNQRIDIVNNANADCLISIHQNSYTDSSVRGAQVFYHGSSEKSKKLAEQIQNNIKNYVDENNNRLCKEANDLFLLKKSICPSVILECGFLSCPAETKKLVDEQYQQKMAETIADAVVTWCREEK